MTTVISVPVTTVWTSPDAPRDVDAAIVADTPDPVAWNDALLAAPPSALYGRTLTQALLGEPVRVVSERGGWAEIILPWQPSSGDPAGYPGWVPAAHIVDADPPDAPLSVVTTATVSAGDCELSYGTVLPEVERTADVVRLAAPGGVLEAPTHAIEGVPAPAGTRDIEAILASARMFMGLRYLWGGTSAWGLDCSGFVHLVHRRFGITVPRDAHDQIDASARIEPADAAPGDLYFFGVTSRGITHVGFATNQAGGEMSLLHAANGGEAEHIEDAAMTPARTSDLAGAGTFLK